ncbi:CP [Diodia vein chlorosis virus]|uniref:CP n=1 Tax=Diodia vein chlorosis virus TaxID=656520 RepID=E7BKK2_9CLOS|nr:CP [Diodia vein chlorosis virus]ADU25038.1 CP [Diodia vein chlorosis virus]
MSGGDDNQNSVPQLPNDVNERQVNADDGSANVSRRDDTINSMLKNITRRDDITSQETYDPEMFKNIKVSAERGDTLNDEQNTKFNLKMKDFCGTVVKMGVDETSLLAFFCSLILAMKNQSTSTKNSKQIHLINTFTHNGTTFTWRTADFITFMKSNFPEVPNPIRRYLKRNEDVVARISAAAKLDSDGHLAAKHGTTAQYWNSTADFLNGCKTNISDDDLAANYLQRQAATRMNKKNRQIYNVNQLAADFN